MSRTRTALVIGGGVAGPAVAMALQKAGIEPVVYEAYPTGADDIGVFLTLASNGVDALRVLGADVAALAVAFPTPGITVRSGSGKRLGESRTGGSLSDGTTSQTLKRADLYRVLHQERRAGAFASSMANGWSWRGGSGRRGVVVCQPATPRRAPPR